MKRLILLGTLFVAARAEATPDGCYVAFSNPGVCYNGGIDLVYQFDADNNYHYGVTTGFVVSALRLKSAQLNACSADYAAASVAANNCGANYNQCSAAYSAKDAEFNTCANNYLGLYEYSQGQTTAMKKLNSTIRSLKRRCGSRCR